MSILILLHSDDSIMIMLSITTTEESVKYTQLSGTLNLRNHGSKYISLYCIEFRTKFGSSGPLSCCKLKERERVSNFAIFLVKLAFPSYHTLNYLLQSLISLSQKFFKILQEILKGIGRKIKKGIQNAKHHHKDESNYER
jgi:hypothetical protein